LYKETGDEEKKYGFNNKSSASPGKKGLTLTIDLQGEVGKVLDYEKRGLTLLFIHI